jgi:hypothetical protein
VAGWRGEGHGASMSPLARPIRKHRPRLGRGLDDQPCGG